MQRGSPLCSFAVSALVAVVLLLAAPSSTAGRSELRGFKTFNMLTPSLWKATKLTSGFYPLGFSRDGWFAYVAHPAGDTLEDAGPSCPRPPCRDGVSVVSLACEDPCHGDAPSHPGDMCWCPMGARASDLSRLGIKPLGSAAHGAFPATVDGDALTVELQYREKLIPSEVAAVDPKTKRVAPPGPELPGTAVYLVSRRLGRKLIRTLDHNHLAIAPRSVRAVGWIKSPVGGHLAVVLGYLTRLEGRAPSVAVEVAGVTLAAH